MKALKAGFNIYHEIALRDQIAFIRRHAFCQVIFPKIVLI